MTKERLRAPFPWFGGKSRVADLVWRAFGDVPNYIEPFFGSGAVLIARQDWQGKTETINDKDGFVSNFWRSIKHAPGAVATYADWPVNENDLHARHSWLVQQKQELTAKLESDPDYCDPKVAGFWVWGMCAWIGGGFCSGDGPWSVVDGKLTKMPKSGGVSRKMPHLGDGGRGINKQRPHLSDGGQGINKQIPHLGDGGQGINKRVAQDRGAFILEWCNELSERLRGVRVCSGDWSRICGPAPTFHNGVTGVFLDPPYSADRSEVYTVDDFSIAHEVREWCKANGSNKKLRIALCGYQGEHEELEALGWSVLEWSASNGYQSSNGHRERIWFSPWCLREEKNIQCSIFDELNGGVQINANRQS